MHKLMMGLARKMAILGGMVLVLLILLTCLSIIGRLLNGVLHGDFMQGLAPDLSNWLINYIGPINGDFEMVEAGVAFAIFAFIPLCQITSGHASVDVVANAFPRKVNRFLRMVIAILFAGVLGLITVKLADGMIGKYHNGETSFLLEFPTWWAYAASLFGATMAAIVGIYMAIVRTTEFMTGRIQVWDGVEGEQ
ncbi:TRAP transporter small permease [Phycobacter azelaicus]|jgi:TRAP-type C4-dicarboxylate transport system permease small subunit|uniref:TRAP transporter small permease n=1 Tax=Phycobacter azelaicus TaxID=2668075 RepID=UPI0018660771|nr:TRAP transporter small permease [Phycobacter azelaicus]MBE1297941.1 TRAP transporter small permease subunit [Paracoccaceae bacterium]